MVEVLCYKTLYIHIYIYIHGRIHVYIYICSTCSQSALFVIGIPLLWHPFFVCVLPRPCWAEEKLHDEVQSFCHAFTNSHGRSLAWLVCGFLLKTKGCVLPVVKQHKTDINQDESSRISISIPICNVYL